MRYHVVGGLAVALLGLMLVACGDGLEQPPPDAAEIDAGAIDATDDCDAANCPQPTCTDGTENGDETDVDCGGSCAPGRRCGDGLGCSIPGDCQSGVCTGDVCQAPSCGDGVRQGNEACDDGNHTNGDGCDDGTGGNCRPTGCGNGVRSGAEECDDGNSTQGDGCDNNCTTTGCGNGVITSGEVCDDDDTMGGDGCSATCQVEPGFMCSMVPSVCVGMCGDGVVVGTEACDDPPPAENGDGCSITCTQEPGYTCTGSPSVCTTSCGDGVRAGGEGCDDAPPAESGDGCNNLCFVEPGWVCVGTPSFCFPICGDGRVVGSEACDDPAPAESGDGCSAQCLVETGWTCAPGSPSACTPICGDGMRLGGEMCDDVAPAEDGDGCSATCTVEAGWMCSGTPSTCVTMCGDGIRAGTEACDDAAPAENGDGCSATCTVESGYQCTGDMPSTCAPICGDGLVKPGEPCDDPPPAEDGDGCSAMCTVEPGYVCSGEPSNCQLTCGDGDVDPGEACDDPAPAEDGDGCSAGCAIEFGYTCSGTPSVCVTTCGDGLKAPIEACDDAPPAEDNDGCSASCAIENGWTCTGNMPSTCITTCGDGVRAGTEQCDDGCGPTTPGVCDASDNGDGCTSTCTLECGDGVFNPAIEECDDGGRVAGDGCSPTCTFEITCGPGETYVHVSSTDVPKAIPDNSAVGVDSTIVIPAVSQGAVRQVVVGIARINHTFDGDLLISLVSPTGRSKFLSSRRGGSGDNFVNTLFTDAATTLISSGVAPFTGRFRPDDSLSALGGFGAQSAAGTWRIHAKDAVGGDTGSIINWTLAMCVDPTVFCGNGAPDAGEECDDGNTVDNDACSNSCGVADGCGDGNLDTAETCDDGNIGAGDGCSATCQLELSCGPGQVPVIVSNPNGATITNDNMPNLFPVMVPLTGGVRRAVVYVHGVTHSTTNQIDMFLQSPAAVVRELSTDNPSLASFAGNYVATIFDDSGALPVTSLFNPFTARTRPEQSLSALPTVDLTGTNAAGVWDIRVLDDDAATVTGTFDGWTLGLCVDPTAYCGDGIPNGTDECDDGNTINNDACSNLCAIADGCGDGNIDTGEQCDDNNVTPGDGCSATCTLDIGCAAGETPLILTASPALAIPDSNNAGTLASLDVATAGLVRRAIVGINITHTFDGDLDVFLSSPFGVQRDLTTDNGSGGDNFTGTLLSDSALTAVTSGTAPFTGTFRPEQSISDSAGFGNQSAAGRWSLRLVDDAGGDTGTLNSWSLALCIDTSATSVCGNGYVEATETCDDGNVAAGDGCSASCALELTCPAGQTPVVTKSIDTTPLLIVDNNATGVSMPINVAQTGTVRRAVVVVGAISHQNDAHLDLSLVSPAATSLDLSSDNGGTGDDYVSTMLDDTAGSVVTSGVSPFRGRFRPEAALTGVANQASAGTWNLKAVDDTSVDAGAVHHWVLGLCVE